MLVAVQLSCSGLYLPASVQASCPVISAPDDHFAAGPHRRVTVSGSGRIGGAGGCPTIRARDCISRRCSNASAIISAPDDHFTAGPDCRVTLSGSGRVGDAGGCPTIGAGIVSPAGVQIDAVISIRPRRSFRCRSTPPCERTRPAGALVVLVAVQLSVPGLYLPPVFIMPLTSPAPDDHFTAGPHCRVTVSAHRARWWCWWLSNCPCWDCICPPVFKIAADRYPRPRRSFHCRSRLPCESLAQRARWWCW